jgi:excisionase family DNA binding protein
MANAHPNDLMTVADAGKILGLSADMVRLLERSGRLCALRTTRGVRLFRRADVDRLAQDRKRDRRSAAGKTKHVGHPRGTSASRSLKLRLDR